MTTSRGAARGSTETVRILKSARTRLARGWCRGSYAKNRMGLSVEETSRAAVSWCAMGAILASGASAAYLDRANAEDFVCDAAREPWLTGWNDSPRRTKKQVLAAFDRAIKLASRASAPKGAP